MRAKRTKYIGKVSLAAGVEVQLKADATSLRLIRYNVSWIATPLAERLKPSQVRLIEVWKVCSSYHRNGSVPGDVNTAHHIFFSLH